MNSCGHFGASNNTDDGYIVVVFTLLFTGTPTWNAAFIYILVAPVMIKVSWFKDTVQKCIMSHDHHIVLH